LDFAGALVFAGAFAAILGTGLVAAFFFTGVFLVEEAFLEVAAMRDLSCRRR
jgi:hypothetical protein